jgi:hypothetical protein
MKSERIIQKPHLDTLARTPPWVTSARGETLEDVAFLSGAALATLHHVVGRQVVPQALLRERLALSAAEAYGEECFCHGVAAVLPAILRAARMLRKMAME